MLAERPRATIAKNLRPKRRMARAPGAAVSVPNPGRLELHHLASVVLSKSPEDLAAIAAASPLTHADWLLEFEAQRTRVENELAFWAAAVAILATAPAVGTANDG